MLVHAEAENIDGFNEKPSAAGNQKIIPAIESGAC